MDQIRIQLKKMMLEKGFSGMKTLSDAAKLESSTVRKFLDGSARSLKVDTLYKLSNALEVYPSDLFPPEWQKPLNDELLIEAIEKMLEAREKSEGELTTKQLAQSIALLYKKLELERNSKGSVEELNKK